MLRISKVTSAGRPRDQRAKPRPHRLPILAALFGLLLIQLLPGCSEPSSDTSNGGAGTAAEQVAAGDASAADPVLARSGASRGSQSIDPVEPPTTAPAETTAPTEPHPIDSGSPVAPSAPLAPVAGPSPAPPRRANLVPPGSGAAFEAHLRAALAAELDQRIAWLEWQELRIDFDSAQRGMPSFHFGGTQTSDLAAASALAQSAGFSSTNVQEAGVDEADRVEFDGRFLFVAIDGSSDSALFVPGIMFLDSPVEIGLISASSGASLPREPARIRVLETEAAPPTASEVAEIEVPEPTTHITGLFHLAAERAQEPDLLAAVGSDAGAGWRPEATTTLHAFDVSDPQQALPRFALALEGNPLASRRIGDRLFLVTRHELSAEIASGGTLEELRAERDRLATVPVEQLLPELRQDGGAAEPLASPENCLVLPGEPAPGSGSFWPIPSIVTITAIDVRRPADRVSVCMLGRSDFLYASPAALFAVGGDATGGVTRVHKFAMTPDGPAYRGSGEVPGMAHDSFRLGERDGVLGIVTSVWRGGAPAHRLTLLRESAVGPALEEVSHLPNEERPEPIGKPGELLRGVRFLGGRIYLVTFRMIDPLYVIDASDPARPFIAGEVEVPGFSDYLHPVGADLVIGVGMQTDANGLQSGVKVELFDVSHPDVPRSLAAEVIGERGSSSPVPFSHHAFAFLAGEGAEPDRFGVPVVRYAAPADSDLRGGFPSWTDTALHLFEIARDAAGAPTLSPRGSVVAERADELPRWPSSSAGDRSVIAGDAVHYVHGDSVWSAPWADPDAVVGPQ